MRIRPNWTRTAANGGSERPFRIIEILCTHVPGLARAFGSRERTPLARRAQCTDLTFARRDDRSPIGRRLDAVQFRIRSALGHQLVVAANFGDARPVEYDDEVAAGVHRGANGARPE